MRVSTTVALAAGVLLLSSPAAAQRDCYDLLRGANQRPISGSEPIELSSTDTAEARRQRVCIMTFVQLDALRPLLDEDPALAPRLRRIDALYAEKKQRLALSRPSPGRRRGGFLEPNPLKPFTAEIRPRLSDELTLRSLDTINDDLDDAIHGLGTKIVGLSSRRLGAIADRLRSNAGDIAPHNPLQAELFARFLQVRALASERERAAIVAVANDLRTHTTVNVLRDSGVVDVPEKGTYYRAESLWTAIQAFELEAAAELARPNDPVAVSLFARFLDLPATSLDVLPGTPQPAAILPAVHQAMTHLAAAAPSSVGRLPGVLGSSHTPRAFDVYLESKADHPLKVLRYDKVSGQLRILDGLSTFQAHVHTMLVEHSTPKLRLANVMKEGSGYALEFADRKISLSGAEFLRLNSGRPLPYGHPLSREVLDSGAPLVIFSHPLMQPGSRHLQEAEQLGFALQHAYPSARVYRDDFTARTPLAVRAVDELVVRDAARVSVILADESFRVDDKKAIQNVRALLLAKGIDVQTWHAGQRWTGGGGRSVFVVTGHIDKQLAAFVRELGDAGVFKDNYVVFASCYGSLSTELVAEMNTAFKAAATFKFEGQINPYDVADAIGTLGARLAEHQGTVGFGRVLKRTLGEFGLNGIWTVCRAVFGLQEAHV
jgi:hypothetical protein